MDKRMVTTELIAMRMAQQVSEIHAGQRLEWYAVDIDAGRIVKADEETETRQIGFHNVKFKLVQKPGGFSAYEIICELERKGDHGDWIPKMVLVMSPFWDTRDKYVYTPVGHGESFYTQTWKIDKVASDNG
jgi:hypothetical protein